MRQNFVPTDSFIRMLHIYMCILYIHAIKGYIYIYMCVVSSQNSPLVGRSESGIIHDLIKKLFLIKIFHSVY